MKRIFSILFALVLAVSLMLVPAASVGASPGPGLVALWHLDEGSGTTAYDSTPNNNDGTIYGATYVDGRFSKALSFDGVDDYVSVPDSASLDIGTSDFTIEAWIKLGTTANDYYGIYDKGKGLTSGEGRYSLFVTPSDTLRLHIYGQSGGEQAYYDSTLTIDDTNWHYVAVSCDRDGNAIFAIDDSTETVDISGSSSHDVSSTYDAAIGVRQWDKGDHWFNGEIDEVHIWDEARTASQIQQSYAALHVDDDGAQWPAAYTTIQAAIDAAGTGDTINVAAGTYTEDLVIPGSKTNLELVGATGAKIKGVQELDWPNHAPAISILASGVKIHGFTIESPDYSRTTGNPHSSGIAVGAANVEIYDNTFVSTDDGTGNSPGWSTSIETYGQHGGDVSGLNIHNNTFTSTTGTDKGSEGIYINYNLNNPTPAGTVTITNNTFGGQIFRAISTERSKTTISGNTITSSYAPNPVFNAALRGIDVFSPNANRNPNLDAIVITDNNVNGFWQGIRLGDSGGDILTNISVTENTVEMNTTGIRVYVTANGVVINNNDISGNTTYGVENTDTATTLDATNNWWGDISGPSGMGPGSGDSVSANVNYDPWLTAPWVTPWVTKADILKGRGVPGKGLDKAPGQQKPFNPNSKAGEHAGKKDK